MNRRKVLKAIASVGIGGAVFHRALASLAQEAPEITPEMVEKAEWISGLELSEEERNATARSLQRKLAGLDELRQLQISNDVAPAFTFRTIAPAPTESPTIERAPQVLSNANVKRPTTDEELAFLPVSGLSRLVKNREITSVELTKLYLSRLKKYNPLLNCVVTLTEELAMKQAKRADAEIAAGKYRGPLHGIPWGAKDLIAVPGYTTTWGAPQFKEQTFDYTATVAKRLEDAGAVLVAKLTLGAIAMGDRWFGGMTRCPWNYKVGSSGSSAGSASAAVAGLVGFAIGTETLGSIISPSRRCGATGLRPTFGRVSRHGCMALSWTMDKVGPITRSVEDCALVFAAIHGADGLDATAESHEFAWPPKIDLKNMTVGYTKSRREVEDREDLKKLKSLGVKLKEVEIPKRENMSVRSLTSVLDVEAAAAFEDLTRTGNLEGLNSWGSTFRTASFIPAVDYVRAMRARRMLQNDFEEMMKTVDVIVNANDLVHTNLTGHPSVVIPVGFRERGGLKLPFSTIFTGQLNRETEMLALAKAYQDLHTTHLEKPPLDQQIKQKAEELAKEKAEAAEKQNAKSSDSKKEKSEQSE